MSYTYDMSGMRSSKTVVYGVGEAHTHEYTSAVTAPTCTTAGYTTYTCDCGESYVDNLVDALGHNYVQSGNVYTCSRCGDSYTGHEHTYTEQTTEPTCLTAGYTVYTCSCGDSYTVEIPALGHNYVLVGQSGNVATYECSRCGHRYTAVIPVDPQPPVEYSLRSSNTVTEHHEYVYASGKLMRETITTTNGTNTTTQVLDFIYGSGSTPLALVYTNGTASPVTYYYVTNMQGDVVKLVTAGGTVVASYAYDAWGRITTATGSMAEVNPIRYRGYYYDSETGLYYLQSRYYDPAVRRFMNADGVASTGQGFVGFNMFLYCLNNPISMYDSDGWCSKFLLWKIDCGKKNCKDSEAYDPSTPRIAILYDGNMNSYFKGLIGDRGFRDQGKCFIGIFGIHEALGNCTVEDYAYTNMDEFVDSWNSLSGEYTAILVLGHGYAGGMSCAGQSISNSGNAEYTFDSLDAVSASAVYLLICDGSTESSSGSVASHIAFLTNGSVFAVADGKLNYFHYGGIYFPYATEGGRWTVTGCD